jgi:hypothetical protein
MDRPMLTRIILVALLALPAAPGGSPWEKLPEKWNLADVSRILQDSPWSPAGVKLERQVTARYADRQTGLVSDDPVNGNTSNPVPGIQISRSKPQPKIPVIWWSSRTIRLAEQRLRQLSDPALAADPLRAEELPDYVLVIEGSEALAILKDAKEDLHDSVFLELTSGMTLDLGSVRFFDGTEREEARTEFHFPSRSLRSSSSIAKLQPRRRGRVMTMRCLFALSSSRERCGFTACRTFEAEKRLAILGRFFTGQSGSSLPAIAGHVC